VVIYGIHGFTEGRDASRDRADRRRRELHELYTQMRNDMPDASSPSDYFRLIEQLNKGESYITGVLPTESVIQQYADNRQAQARQRQEVADFESFERNHKVQDMVNTRIADAFSKGIRPSQIADHLQKTLPPQFRDQIGSVLSERDLENEFASTMNDRMLAFVNQWGPNIERGMDVKQALQHPSFKSLTPEVQEVAKNILDNYHEGYLRMLHDKQRIVDALGRERLGFDRYAHDDKMGLARDQFEHTVEQNQMTATERAVNTVLQDPDFLRKMAQGDLAGAMNTVRGVAGVYRADPHQVMAAVQGHGAEVGSQMNVAEVAQYNESSRAAAAEQRDAAVSRGQAVIDNMIKMIETVPPEFGMALAQWPSIAHQFDIPEQEFVKLAEQVAAQNKGNIPGIPTALWRAIRMRHNPITMVPELIPPRDNRDGVPGATLSKLNIIASTGDFDAFIGEMTEDMEKLASLMRLDDMTSYEKMTDEQRDDLVLRNGYMRDETVYRLSHYLNNIQRIMQMHPEKRPQLERLRQELVANINNAHSLSNSFLRQLGDYMRDVTQNTSVQRQQEGAQSEGARPSEPNRNEAFRSGVDNLVGGAANTVRGLFGGN
jgi:hypothetical protein